MNDNTPCLSNMEKNDQQHGGQGLPAPVCSASTERENRVIQQSLASERFRATPQWIDASMWLPKGTHEVLATDLEGWFIACYQDGEWTDMEDVPFDSEITHWMELPEIPEG